MVTVELQLCSDLFISLGDTYRIENKIDRLFRPCLVCNDAVVIEVADHREVKEALTGSYVRNICYPLLVRPLCDEVTVEKIRKTVESFPVLHIPPSPNDRKQTVLVHYSENGFRIVTDSVSFQPDMYSSVAIGAPAFNLALADLLGQREILCRCRHPLYIPIIAAA